MTQAGKGWPGGVLDWDGRARLRLVVCRAAGMTRAGKGWPGGVFSHRPEHDQQDCSDASLAREEGYRALSLSLCVCVDCRVTTVMSW